MTPTRRNYITVAVPRDLSSDPDERFDLAILQAKERMRTYIVPALWRVVWDQGEYIRLCRESYSHNARLDTGHNSLVSDYETLTARESQEYLAQAAQEAQP